MVRTYIVLILLLFSSEIVLSGWMNNADNAFSEARTLHKPLLMVFSGSDWCPGCIQFEKQVLSTDTFEKFSEDQLVVLIVDFPQRKKIDKELRAQNEQLAEKYNPQSTFPRILFFSTPDSDPTEIIFINQDEDVFINELKALVSKGNQ